jgi:hypothetical protein
MQRERKGQKDDRDVNVFCHGEPPFFKFATNQSFFFEKPKSLTKFYLIFFILMFFKKNILFP